MTHHDQTQHSARHKAENSGFSCPVAASRFSTGADVSSSDALIQEHYAKEVTNSIGPVSAAVARLHTASADAGQCRAASAGQCTSAALKAAAAVAAAATAGSAAAMASMKPLSTSTAATAALMLWGVGSTQQPPVTQLNLQRQLVSHTSRDARHRRSAWLFRGLCTSVPAAASYGLLQTPAPSVEPAAHRSCLYT